MSPKKNNISLFFKTLPKNIFSGFVVSLIALPLGLGLAMASEAPPVAGIITAIVSGIVMAFFGGSNVTITGPGNGMVGVTLVAITVLGLNGAYAAIICSGMVLIIFGFLRLGKLSDFFPSSALQGMLTAIGLIILGKQFHIMLGHKITRDTNLQYLMEIPQAIYNLFFYTDSGFTYAAISGVLSLAIMVFYPRLRNKFIQLIPAPMWIVILSIGFSYFYELILLKPNPIHSNYMISGVPNASEIITQIPTPDFSSVLSLPFWSSVIALLLIASIESLLSIKAIDKLDPEKRRSNVNKDLKALGLATVGSGFLGGLNVVTVIARSSVNVNNGGTNRSSNLFHALFLVLFILLFSTQLTRIPMPALMAILVFTGYKLAAPSVFKKIFSIGKEQLIIFFVTLFVTLQVSLIAGISAGVVATLFIHFIINKSAAIFLRNILKPNVLMFYETTNEHNNYYVSVKHFCTFLNYYKLKDKLDAIPETSDVIVDFSLCEFVDHTVMENLNNYQELFSKRDGHFEVVGLDMHDTDSKHPFALRRLLPDSKITKAHPTKRQKTMEGLAEKNQLHYLSKKIKNTHFLDKFLFFRTKQINHIYNQLSNRSNSITLFDIEFSEGEFIAKEVVRTTMLYIKLGKNIPEFTLDREGFLEKVYAFAGFRDIQITNNNDFSKHFHLLGEDEEAIKSFFDNEITHFFESNPYYHIESNGSAILVFEKERMASIKEIKALFDFGKRLHNTIS